jgi:hypothetical protein
MKTKKAFNLILLSVILLSFSLNSLTATTPIWSIQVVDNSTMVGRTSSIALDSSDNPCISYFDSMLGALKYAKWTSSAWSVQTVETGNLGEYSSLALDSKDNPCISYFDKRNGDLKYAKWTGSAWTIQVTDSPGSVGKYTSLALDSNDSPSISYQDYANEDLKYARGPGLPGYSDS